MQILSLRFGASHPANAAEQKRGRTLEQGLQEVLNSPYFTFPHPEAGNGVDLFSRSKLPDHPEPGFKLSNAQLKPQTSTSRAKTSKEETEAKRHLIMERMEELDALDLPRKEKPNKLEQIALAARQFVEARARAQSNSPDLVKQKGQAALQIARIYGQAYSQARQTGNSPEVAMQAARNMAQTAMSGFKREPSA